MVEIKNLTKKFHQKTIISNLSLQFPDSGLVVLEGENGSGKTTLINLLIGLDNDYSGDILFDGKKLKSLKDKEKKELFENDIDIIFQKNNYLSFLSNKDYAKFFCPHSKNDVSPSPSQGEKMCLLLDEILNSEAGIIVLDECLSHLSLNKKQHYFAQIKEKSKTALILIVSHDFPINEYALRLHFLPEGKIDIIKRLFKPADFESTTKTERNKVPSPFLLSLKKVFHLKPVYFIYSLLSLIFLSFSWIGSSHLQNFHWLYSRILSQADSCYVKLNSDYKHVIPESILSHSQFVMKSTTDEYVVLHESIHDSYAHVSPSMYNNLDKSYINSNGLTWNIIKDDQISDNYYHVSSDLNLASPYLQSVEGEYWDTETHYASYHQKKSDKVSGVYFVTASYIQNLGYTIDTELEDNVLYTDNTSLLSKIDVSFPKRHRSINDISYDYSKIFSSCSVKTKYLSLGKINQGSFYEYVLVSQPTMKHILTYPMETSLLIDLKNNRQSTISFLANHHINIKLKNASDRTSQTASDIRQLESYNQTINNTVGKTSYLLLFWLGLSSFFVLSLILSLFLYKTNGKDNVILITKGYSKRQILIINEFFHNILHIIYILISLLLTFFTVGGENQFFLVPPTMITCLVFLGVTLLCFLCSIAINLRRKI